MRALLAALALTIALPAHAEDAATAATLRDKALEDDTAWTLVSSLSTDIGARPAGTEQMVKATDWAVRQFTKLGFKNVRVEPFDKKVWLRGAESAEILGDEARPLTILGLGRSPTATVEGEVVVFHSYAELLDQPEGSLTGKIVVINQPMARAQDGSGYGALSTARRQGPVQAAKRGAVGFLIRSLSTADDDYPHAGAAVTSVEEWPSIPGAALSIPDAEMLDELAAKGPVRVRLSLESTVEDTTAWNISGEIVGSEKPDEVIVIGAHLDSWDVGQGASDDGAGIAITTAAARLIGDLPKPPRRTVRVVMFGSEEMAGSDVAYAEAHKGENIAAASESDFGAAGVWAWRAPKGSLEHRAMKTAARVLAPLAILTDPTPATSAGEDVEGLREAGVPMFSLRQDGYRYFDLHHSAADTLDKIDREGLNQSVAAWAALVYLIADSDIDFRALGAAQ